MRGITHLITTTTIASIAGAYMFNPTTIIDAMLCLVGTLAVMFGSIAPDIDIKHSMVRKWYVMLPTLPVWLAQFAVHVVLGKIYGFKHRGVMHSIIGWAASFGMIGALADIAFGRTVALAIASGFAFGYLMHLIEDEVTTKTKIDWLPEPKFMKSWSVGVLLVLAVLMMVAPIVSAAGDAKQTPTIKEIDFDDASKNVKSTFTSLYFFTIFIITLIAGTCAAIGHKTTAIRLVQGVIGSFFIVYVLPGILFGWTS